jgi:hypothetical protein
MNLFVASEQPAVKLNFFRKSDSAFHGYTQPDGYCGYRINYQIHQMFQKKDFSIVSDRDVNRNNKEFLSFLESNLPELQYKSVEFYAAREATLPRKLWYTGALNDRFPIGLNRTLQYTALESTQNCISQLIAKRYVYLDDTNSYKGIKQALESRRLSTACYEVHYYFLEPLEDQTKIFTQLVKKAVSEFFKRRSLFLASPVAKALSIRSSNSSDSNDNLKQQRRDKDSQGSTKGEMDEHLSIDAELNVIQTTFAAADDERVKNVKALVSKDSGGLCFSTHYSRQHIIYIFFNEILYNRTNK